MNLASQTPSLSPDLSYEKKFGFPQWVIVGADEVGRGCLAGPVVAGAVALPPQIDWEKDPWLYEIKDSKKLTAPVREKLAPLIQKWALSSGIGVASVEEIDRINIFHASHLAIVRAIQAIQGPIHHILIDGKFLPREKLPAPATAVIKGDLQCLSIAAASIIAKVWRDDHMQALEAQFPGYGLSQHKGYPTQAHSKALKKLGITPVHRKSFNLSQSV